MIAGDKEALLTLSAYESYENYRDDPVTAERIREARSAFADILTALESEEVMQALAGEQSLHDIKHNEDSASINLQVKMKDGLYFPLLLNMKHENTEDEPMRLSLTSPGPEPLHPFHFLIANAAGVSPKIYRVHELLCEPNATELPMRWADYSYVYDYRPLGPELHKSATNGELDYFLNLVALSEPASGIQLREVVPSLANIVPAQIADGGILATP